MNDAPHRSGLSPGQPDPDAPHVPAAPPRPGSRWAVPLQMVVFDIAGPLVAYHLLRARLVRCDGLVLAGILPAAGIGLGALLHRPPDAIGYLVLSLIAVGAVLGLILHSARAVLLSSCVPTALFGVFCLVSLRTGRPLIYRFALATWAVPRARRARRGRPGGSRWPAFGPTSAR